MPGYDGTGPEGRGEMTGGGRGFCALPVADVAGRPRRFARVGGRGGGYGRRNVYRATGLTRWQREVDLPGANVEDLKREAELLKAELAEVQRRIDEAGRSEQK